MWTTRRRFAAALSAMTLALSGVATAQYSLTTLFSPTHHRAGNMFDVVALSPVTIQNLDLHLEAGLWDVSIHTRQGTLKGNETNAAAWELRSVESMVWGQGAGVPTPLSQPLNIPISPGQTLAFWVTVTNGSGIAGMWYSDVPGSVVGSIAAQDQNLQILVGIGTNWPLSQTYFSPRAVNCTIHYDAGNPVPILDSVIESPVPACVALAGFTLNVQGSRFIPASVLRWNGADLATTYIDQYHLAAVVPPGLASAVGSEPITIFNPPPGGGESNIRNLVYDHPPIGILSLSPSSAPAGSGPLSLSITGGGYVPNATQVWFGPAVLAPTTPSCTSPFAVTIPANLLVSPGTVDVRCWNPGTGTSNTLTFTITNPPPAIASMSPSSAYAGAPAFTLTVNGTGFLSQAVLKWNSNPLPTIQVTSTQLQATVSQSLVTAAGTATVSVDHPTSGPSAPVSFPIRNTVPGAHELISVGYLGDAPDGDCGEAMVSRNGRFVAFSSVAPNLVPGDTNGRKDIFIRDLLTLTTVRVTGPAGEQFAGDSTSPSLSGDGRYLAFVTDLSAGSPTLPSAPPQVLRVDRDSDNDGIYDESNARTVTIASVDAAGGPANAACRSGRRAISDNGQKITFESAASDLVLAAAGGVVHVFLRDLALGQTTLVTATAAGIPLNQGGSNAAISGNGSWVALQSDATNAVSNDLNNATDIFRKNPSTGAIQLVSRLPGPSGAQGNGPSRNPAISGNGLYVTFESLASNLGGYGGDGTFDVFWRDLGNDRLEPVSEDPDEYMDDGDDEWGDISDDGYVGFVTEDSDLFPSDLNLLPDVMMWNYNYPLPVGSPRHIPVSTYNYPVGECGMGASGYGGLSIAHGGSFVTYSSRASNLLMGSFVTPLTHAFIIGTWRPLDLIGAPAPDPDANPVTFSVDGPVDLHAEAITRPRGGGLPPSPLTRSPAVPQAEGLTTFRPGDVHDYEVASLPSEAELFQSEPDAPVAARPSGTDNQILVAGENGLVAGRPTTTYRDNLDGVSFGEDYFGVTSLSAAPAPILRHWGSRPPTPFPEPVVIGDSGTSFRFSVNPWAIGLPPTAVRAESLGSDFGAGTGPWISPGQAAGDVFGTPVLHKPGPPPAGINARVHDEESLALATPPTSPLTEDDLDGLECVGENNWGGSRQPGNLHARVVPAPGTHPGLDLAGPAVPNHVVGGAPVFFTVDRNSKGEALSAVRTQALAGEAAADVFMTWAGTTFLLIDETEAGLYPGSPIAPGNVTDDMDALILRVEPESRTPLLVAAQQALAASTVVDPTPGWPNSGDEYRSGAGFSYSLLRYAYFNGVALRIRLGFSVTNDSIGLERTAVDFEAGLDPSGTMQQSGDVFYTEFGPASSNPFPVSTLGMNWNWYEEAALGLHPGAWVIGLSSDMRDLPDELDALDTLCSEPRCPTSTMYSFGYGCAGSYALTPILRPSGWAAAGQPLAVTLYNAPPAYHGWLFGSWDCDYWEFPWAVGWGFYFDCDDYWWWDFDVSNPPGAASGDWNLAVLLPPDVPPFQVVLQAVLPDAPGTFPGFMTSNAVRIVVP